MNARYMLVVMVLSLAACGSQFRQAESGFKQSAEETGTAALNDAVYYLCHGPVGPLARLFQTPEKIRAWQTLCNTEFEPRPVETMPAPGG